MDSAVFLIRGLSGKFPNISRKNFLVLPWSISALSPSKYSHLLFMHRCQPYVNVLKHSWKAVLGILRKCASEFVLIASVDSKQRPFSVDLRLETERSQLVQDLKSTEAVEGQSSRVWPRSQQTRNDECEGALSCWCIHRFSHQASGLFFLTASRRRCITSR